MVKPLVFCESVFVETAPRVFCRKCFKGENKYGSYSCLLVPLTIRPKTLLLFWLVSSALRDLIPFTGADLSDLYFLLADADGKD
jgi:hypothetical protein